MKSIIIILLIIICTSFQTINRYPFYTPIVITEEEESLGPEKVVNGTFETGTISPWSVRADWNIQAASGGEYGSYWLRHTAGAANTEPQDINLIQGRTYRVTYTVVGRTAGTVMVSIGNVDGTNRTADGTYTEDITTTGTDEYVRFEAITTTFDGAVDNLSVKEVL